MAQRRRRDANYNDGTWGVSEKALKALDTGTYGQLTGRKSKYRTSQEQTQQTQDFPMLEGMFDTGASDKIWESNFAHRRTNKTIDTGRARRSYEQRIGHNAEDFRNLRNRGYGSSSNLVDPSKLEEYTSLLDIDLDKRDSKPVIDLGDNVNNWLESRLGASEEDKIKNAQWYIDTFGKSKDEVLDAYSQYKANKEREARETTPFKAGFKDFKSAPDRGIANAVKYFGQNYLPDSDIEKAGDWLREFTGANEVEKQRNYSRESNKIGNFKKAMLDPYFQYGDLASSELAAGLLSGGAMADPAAGVGMMFEGNPLLKGAMKYGTGYGLTADEKYNQLVRQGVDEDEAAKLANISGLSMVAAQAAGKLVPTLGATTSLAQRLLTNGGINSTIMAGRQGLEEIADILIRENQSDYNQSVQKHIAEGMTPEQADKAAKAEIYTRVGGAGLFGLLMGAGSEIARNGLSKAVSKAADNADDVLNSVWATQPALEGESFPQLTGTVDNTQALTGSQYNVPALVDNIYPIQMPGTNGVINLPGETAPIQLPDLAAKSAPKTMKESTGLTNRVIAKLTGEPLTKAQTRLTEITNRLGELNKQIPEQYNNYKIAPKTKRRAEYKKYEDLNKEKADLIYEQYAVGRQIEGQPEVSRDSKDLISKYIGDLKSVGNMYAGKEGKKLANDAITALQKYEKTGNNRDYFNFVEKVYALENAAVNPYTNKSNGKVTTYGTYYNDEDGSRLTQKILPSESPSLTFEALMQMLVPNAPSAPAEASLRNYKDLIPEAPFYESENYLTLEANNKEIEGQIANLENTRSQLSELLKKEVVGKKTKNEMTPDEKISSMFWLDSTPEKYTVKGEQINNSIRDIDKQIESLKARKREIDKGFRKIKDDARVNQVQNYKYTEPARATKTEYPGFDITKGTNPNSQRALDNGKAYIAEMSPLEYLQRSTYDIDSQATLESVIESANGIDKVHKYAEAMRRGEKFPIPDLTYSGTRGQEGRTRALAAYEAGIDTIPVAIIGKPSANPKNTYKNFDVESSLIPEEDIEAAIAESMSAPRPPKNVNTVPEVTNEPNFTTVGEPYTPQEVPNVKPTPPTPEPPTQEVPNMGGTEKTSKYYNSTMRNTEANQGMSDEEYAQRYNEELYKYMTRSEQQSVGMAHDFINESGGNDAAIKRLLSDEFDNEERFNGVYVDACHILANDLEQRAMQMEESGQDASELWRIANRLHKKVQENGTVFAQGLQANKKWKKTTSQGALDDLIIDINRGIDNKKTTGYTKNVNKLADKVEDAIASTDDKNEQIARIKDAFAKDRENNPYSTDKAEQLVLNLVGGSKNTKKSVSDLIEEAGKVIKKEMGVSSLSPKEERAVLNLLDAASKLEPGTRAYNVLVSRAMTIVDESLPTTIGEKAKALLYDNMLASIKTMFTRNFGGNVVGNAIDFMAAPFQVGADAVVGKFTKARTRTLTGKSIVEAAKGLGHGFKDWGQDIGYSIKNKTQFNTPRSGQESLKDVLNAVHKTWKTQSDNKVKKAVTNALATYDYIIRKGMEGGDRPIYEAQYAATKAELYDVIDKYGDKGLRMGLPADKRDIDTDDLVEAIAINDALEAVLQNDSKMKEAAKDIKAFFKKSSEDMIGFDIASMSHAPFVEVPANMASNFFKLTPIGWIGNINRTRNEKKKYGSINQRRFTGELGLNVLGGLMIGGGTAAAGKYISDAYSDKKEEKKLQQNNGYQEYALQTPDESTQIDISDIPYLGGMMKFSKLERDAYDKDGLKGAIAEIPSAASAATVDTLYQALNRLTGADFQYNGSGGLVQNAINNVKSSVGSMGVPSLVRQTAQFLDPYKRDLGDYGTDEYNMNLIINGIPGLRQTMLEPKIDTAGQPVPELGGATGLNRFLSAYVSPWKVSHPHANTSAVQEYANMLKQTTDGAVNPQMKVINKSDLTGIKGYDAENYSHADLRKLQEAYYKSNTELGNALINDPWFTNLSAEKQGELLDQLWSANKALVKENFVREGLTPEQIEAKGEELYTTDNKLAGIIRDDDENHTGLIKWLHDETDRDAMNEKYGTEMSHDNYVKYNDREEGYAEQRASETDKAKALDMSVDSYEKYEAEYPGGAQGYYDDREGARQYGFVNANKVPNVDSYRIAKELGNGDPNVIQAYSDYKQEGIKSNAYAAKAQYLAEEDRLTDEQKGMIIAGSTDGTKIGSLSKGAQKAYDLGGYAGINYYYLLKDAADADGSGTVTKKERQNFFASDFPMLDELWQTSPDLYNYAMENLK